MIGLFYVVFNFTGNSAGMITAGTERSYKQWKRRWLSKNEPNLLALPVAWETNIKSNLPMKELDLLSEKFVELDRKYTYGLNHELLDKLFRRSAVELTPETYLHRMKKSVTLQTFLNDAENSDY